MTIGSQIALLRKQQSMTQEMLANKLGVSNQAVSKWEAEQCCPDIQLLPQIADIFEVSIDSLFGREACMQKEVVSKEVVSKELPWENDNILRVVAYIGHTLQERQAYDELQNIEFIYEGDLLNVDSCISVSCGNVEGDVDAGGRVGTGM